MPFRLATLLLCVATLGHAVAAQPTEADVRRVWQILDYLSVDYAGAVQGGKVIAQSEFDEMQEFAQTARTKIAALEAKSEQPALLKEADELEAAIKAMSEPTKVATLSKSLANHLIAVYPVPLAPGAVPDVAAGAKLYAANCAACHGATGNGDVLAPTEN